MPDQEDISEHSAEHNAEHSSKDLDSERIEDIHGQTAQLAWSELERFFAGGKLLLVAQGNDLVKVAAAVSGDDAAKVQEWLAKEQLSPVSDQQAQAWHQNNQVLWAVVVAPWVLVQLPKQ